MILTDPGNVNADLAAISVSREDPAAEARDSLPA